MKLARIGLAFYRSIGKQPALIDLRKRATVVVGANNSGKSNVIASLGLLKETGGILTRLAATDRHLRDDKYSPQVVTDFEIEQGDGSLGRTVGELVRLVREFSGNETRWPDNPFLKMEFNQFNTIMSGYLNKHFTRMPNANERAVIEAELCLHVYASLLAKLPEVVFIPQHRQITEGTTYAIHGAGVVELLASWQHPEIGKDEHSEHFAKIQDLLRRLLHLPNVELEVPHDKKTIVVKRDSLRLPLDSYGTGIHQLIVLAVAVLSKHDSLVCIEEPEVNLHPTLQRELLRFLVNHTSNRYVISTHSHALIDPGPQQDVLHVSLVGHVTEPRSVQTTSDSLKILRDLGVRAADLLQSNAVIWVEGPSDRIYLVRWLSLLAPDLVEGVHYAIMFYGGRLLSHLTVQRDPDCVALDLIKLLRINQNSAVVIDSDRKKPRQRLNLTKRRIVQEAALSDVYTWITDGREIENYLASDAIGSAYAKLLGAEPLSLRLGDYDSLEQQLRAALRGRWRPSYSYDDAKPLRAREIAAETQLCHIGPKLRRHLNTLIELVRTASELYHGGPQTLLG